MKTFCLQKVFNMMTVKISILMLMPRTFGLTCVLMEMIQTLLSQVAIIQINVEDNSL